MTSTIPDAMANPLIGLTDLTLGYRRHPAVHHLSGSFRNGSLTAVVGPNGAGKSTLLKAMVGALRPLDGRVALHGLTAADIAYLPQQAEIERDFPIDVLDTVLLGHWRRVGLLRAIGRSLTRQAEDALAAVGLSGFERRPIAALSAGQFQRVLFARLLLQDARLILLDEPFTAIDANTPADARALGAANFVVVNGLGMEGWIDRLVKASGYKGRITVTSAGVKPIAGEEEHDEAGHEEHGHDHGHDHGAYDPHAWQSVANAKIYADNILKGLVAAAPDKADALRANHAAYKAKLEAVETEIKTALKPIPRKDRKIVTSHDAFGYYGKAYGVTFLAPVGMSTESEAAAGDIAKLIRQIKKEKIKAVFVETIADPRLLEQISRETGARIGGRVYSDALSAADGPAATYIDMMRHNLAQFTKALAPAS